MGMRFIVDDVRLSFDGNDRPWSEQYILKRLEDLTQADQEWIRTHPGTPKLYRSGVRYLVPEQLDRQPTQQELDEIQRFHAARGAAQDEIDLHLAVATGVERFRQIPWIVEHGGGDCDNLAAWRAAELRELKIKANPGITSRWSGGRRIYHALVTIYLKDDRRIDEDPSLILGMGGEARRVDREQAIVNNITRHELIKADIDRQVAAGANGGPLYQWLDDLALVPPREVLSW